MQMMTLVLNFNRHTHFMQVVFGVGVQHVFHRQLVQRLFKV